MQKLQCRILGTGIKTFSAKQKCIFQKIPQNHQKTPPPGQDTEYIQ